MIGTWPPGNPRVRAIVIHHSATVDSGTLSWGAIERGHVAKGYDAIGYHGGAELVGDTHQVLIGRPVERTGAHVKTRTPDGIPWNVVALGFCFVGNFDLEAPEEDLLEVASRRWIVPQLHRFGLTPAALIPHRDLDRTACPGSRFDMDHLRGLCQSILLEVSP